MTSPGPNYLLKALSPNPSTLNVRDSTYEFWGDPNIQSWRRQWHPTPVLLPGKSHGWRILVAAVHGVAQSQTQLSNFTFTFDFHALEKETATHSSVLSWRIPGTGEPGGLPSMGLQSWTWLKWLSSKPSVHNSLYIILCREFKKFNKMKRCENLFLALRFRLPD